MSELIDHFEDFSPIPIELKTNLKAYYVFDNKSDRFPFNYNGKNIIFVSKDDDVYAFGANSSGCLGFKHRNPVKEYRLVRELSRKNITNFYNGSNFMIARNENNEIYCWGSNSYGQLGKAANSSVLYEPEKNLFLSDKGIADICCGDYHTLALTENGDVYAWGDNSMGQVGDGSNEKVISKPTKLNSFYGHKIASISCGSTHSMALTKSGLVFSWGSNSFGQSGSDDEKKLYEPKSMRLSNITIKTISCGQNNSHLLSSEGYIYILGKSYLDGAEKNQKIPFKIVSSIDFIDIASNISHSFSVALSRSQSCYVFGKIDSKRIGSPKETDYKSIDEYYAKTCQITLRTIRIHNDISPILAEVSQEHDSTQKSTEKVQVTDSKGTKNNTENATDLYSHKLNTSNPRSFLNKTESGFTSDGKYENDFEELACIGTGGFGSVYKVFHKLDEQKYAIKKIHFKGLSKEEKDLGIKELKLMARLQSDYVVQYKSSWFEYEETLFIQMELCYNTLNHVLEGKGKYFGREFNEVIKPTEFFLSCELLREITECVKFLHKHEPTIIHRDLKPQNILITDGSNNRFVKIGDFGLAKFQKFEEQTNTTGSGTLKYMAPEVLRGRNYNTSADIYSLGVIAQELLNIDVDSSAQLNFKPDSISQDKFRSLFDFILKMIAVQRNQRPSSEKLLLEISSLSLSKEEIKSNSDFVRILNQANGQQKIDDNFYEFFIRKKIEIFL